MSRKRQDISFFQDMLRQGNMFEKTPRPLAAAGMIQLDEQLAPAEPNHQTSYPVPANHRYHCYLFDLFVGD